MFCFVCDPLFLLLSFPRFEQMMLPYNESLYGSIYVVSPTHTGSSSPGSRQAVVFHIRALRTFSWRRRGLNPGTFCMQSLWLSLTHGLMNCCPQWVFPLHVSATGSLGHVVFWDMVPWHSYVEMQNLETEDKLGVSEIKIAVWGNYCDTGNLVKMSPLAQVMITCPLCCNSGIHNIYPYGTKHCQNSMGQVRQQ